MASSFLGFAFGLIGLLLLSLLGFAGIQWLNLPIGSLVDWVLGGAIFWWLLVIVTVPWNIHFQAKEILAEAALSEERDIPIDPKQIRYTQTIAHRALLLALALHIASALGLYILSALGISAIGYIASIAALLLTGLRPAIEAYRYFINRLSLIRKNLAYPREDVAELRSRLTQLEETSQRLDKFLDLEAPNSWAANQQHSLETLSRRIADLTAHLEALQATNDRDHDRLSREARQAISQLSEDSQFLDHIREIIRFFKSA
ncbi:hypothetical protein [Alkalinema sp. FACHB-956]|uniref:hypothetical protein n=1 Tax=Alkalinema sp. FACHB-956 TaxID=2692768 RepID=UPI001684C307|nr:hypothetical protein [Alkalinema sp. FACHB-956]MBD2327149.1 hypothetical protein [Alkalinema sp. FACHB-956]